MRLRHGIATWLFQATKVLTLVAFAIVLLAAIGTHWALAILC